MALNKSELDYKINRAFAMSEARDESGLNPMFEWMDKAFRSQWSLPSELVAEDVEWVHRVTSTDPHDAVRAGVRSLASVMPKVTVSPMMGNPESRALANNVERMLEWIFKRASERKATTILSDVIMSAMLYDEVIISAWYLPDQIDILERFGADTSRLKEAEMYGDFIIKVHNPQDVLVEYSDMMAERVLIREVLPIQQVIDQWGNRADNLMGLREQDSYKDHDYVTVYDYSEIGRRAVWCYLQEDFIDYSQIKVEGAIELLNEETEYKFLPFAAKIGGTALTTEQRFQRIPLLWSVYNSGQWETQNILETLLASEALAYSVSPRYAVESEYENEVPDIDFRDPARIVMLRRGQTMRDLRPPDLNRGLEMLSDRVGQRMDKSTVPRVLQSGDYPSGAAFASLNLATQSGMKSLTPYKVLAETALAELFSKILRWVNYSNKTVEAFIPNNNVAMDENGLPTVVPGVQNLSLGPDDFDPKHSHITVKLTEDVPTDLVQKVNTAGMMVERLRISFDRALEFVGITDPQTVMMIREAEEKRLAEKNAENQKILNESQLEFMDTQRQLAQKMQQVEQMIGQLQQIMAEAEQAQGQGQGQGMGQGMPQGGPGGIGGPPQMGPGPDGSVSPDQQRLLAAQRNRSPFPNSNPANGDMSPVEAAPGVGLREEVQQMEGGL